MYISLSVDTPREAGYGTAMFQALHKAMLADPPAAVTARTEGYSVGEISRSVLTEYAADEARVLHPFGSPEADAANAADEIAQEAAHAVAAGADPATALAAATGKKRGRKSQEQKDAEARAAAVGAQNALRPGDALKGVDAQTLAQALAGMPLVHTSDGTEVRVAPGTPPEEIEAMRARLIAQEAAEKTKAAASGSGAATQAVREGADLLQAITETKPATATTQPPAGMDDDLASLFRRKTPETPPLVAVVVSRFAELTGPALMSEFMTYINGDGGLFWARNVLKMNGLEVMDEITEPQIRDALENPGKYHPAT